MRPSDSRILVDLFNINIFLPDVLITVQYLICSNIVGSSICMMTSNTDEQEQVECVYDRLVIYMPPVAIYIM